MAMTTTAKRTNSAMTTTNYQEVLRTVGAYLDDQGLSHVQVVETDHGFAIQGIRYFNSNGGGTRSETLFLSIDEIRKLMLWL